MLFESLFLALVVLSLISILLRDLILAVIILAGADVVLAVLFYLLAAPDIAITQVAVCAGVLTFIFVLTIKKTKRFEELCD
jgi:multicomponent Na+:H+ antiporter subunit B